MKKIIGVLIILIILTSCQKSDEKNIEEVVQKESCVYLTNEEKTKLVCHDITLEEKELKAQIEKIIQILKDGLGVKEATSTIPSILKVEVITIIGKRANIYFSSNIFELNDLDLLLCRSSLIKSITSLNEVDTVEFFIEGYPMKNKYSKAYGQFYANDIITTQEEARNDNYMKKVKIYFPSKSGDYLIKVIRNIENLNSKSIEEKIIEELRKPPNSDEVINPIPDEAILKSIEIKDGVCYIDFNTAFVEKHKGGSKSEVMTIYAIVNSLTEQHNIKRVQFFIDGKKVETLKGDLDFDILFEYNIGVIKKGVVIND